MGNNIDTFSREFGLIVIGAIIFTASFLWRDLFGDIRDMYFPHHQGILGRAIYTIFLTIALVVLAVHLRFLFGLASEPPTTSSSSDDDSIDSSDHSSSNGDNNSTNDNSSNGNPVDTAVDDLFDLVGMPELGAMVADSGT